MNRGLDVAFRLPRPNHSRAYLLGPILYFDCFISASLMASLEVTSMVMGFDLNERHCQCHPNAGRYVGPEQEELVVDDVDSRLRCEFTQEQWRSEVVFSFRLMKCRAT